MNVIVFENEFENVRTAFAAANLIYFNKSLIIKNYTSAQNCPDLSQIDSKSCIFVDIDLSAKSTMDGFELLDELLKIGFPKNQLLILTGHINIEEKARAKGLGDISVVTKPVDFKALHQALAKCQALLENTVKPLVK
jgi:FixJ family two-component response regulator